MDLELWTEERTNDDGTSKTVILHEFYAKEVSAKTITHARSAMPAAMKRTILTQELLRVMLRCSPLLEWEVTVKHLNGMMKRLQYSGYGHAYRTQILKSALSAYDKIIEKDKTGETPMYRPKEWKREEREKKKRGEKVDWFNKEGAETVIFVPNTPESELKNMYVKEIKKSGLKVKVAESAGRSLKSMLQKSNPFKTEECKDKERCPVCLSGNKHCRRESVTYEIACTNCGDMYVGETGDNAYTRGIQHIQALESKSKDSVLWKHIQTKHNEETPPPIFNMRVSGTYKDDALLRQVAEGNAINRKGGKSMNSKAEWNHQRIPRVVLRDD